MVLVEYLNSEIYLHNVEGSFGVGMGVVSLVLLRLHSIEKLVKAIDRLSIFS